MRRSKTVFASSALLRVPDPAAVGRFAADRLAAFKLPEEVIALPELPRTATGKLQKFKLREQYWKGERRVN